MKRQGIASLRPRNPILGAVERLRAELEKVSDPADRQQVINALDSIADFVAVLKDETETADEIEIVHEHPSTEAVRALSRALKELKYGTVDPILMPNPAQNRPRDTARQREIKMMVRPLYRALREQGINANEASQSLADALNEAGHRYRGRGGQTRITAKTVRDWARPHRV